MREAGFSTLEGSPKIRDASAFTGLTSSLKQSLNAVGPDFCDMNLFSFLRVTTVIMSTATKDSCYDRLTAWASINNKLLDENPVPLSNTDPVMWISNLSRTQVFRTSFAPSHSSVYCGLLTDKTCFATLGLQPTSQWEIVERDCELPCVIRLERTGGSTGDGSIVLPLNARNALRAMDQSGNPVKTTVYNGLVAIPEVTAAQQISIVAQPDIRIWLHVITAYAQYAVFIPYVLRLNVLRKRKRTVIRDSIASSN